eukprot:scaffold30255_cov45-Phaeocystis_antarctica.AAC.3
MGGATSHAQPATKKTRQKYTSEQTPFRRSGAGQRGRARALHQAAVLREVIEHQGCAGLAPHPAILW